jgi:hypothetical protein
MNIAAQSEPGRSIFLYLFDFIPKIRPFDAADGTRE